MPALVSEQQNGVSPFETLNDQFSQQNNRFEALLARLNDRLNKLSATPIPQEALANKQSEPQLPFNDGHLLTYYYRLNNQASLLNAMEELVWKVEALV